MPHPAEKVDKNKRTFLALGRTLFVTGISGWVFFLYEKLGGLRSEAIEIEDLFPNWSDFQVVPGTHHPVYGYHPEIQTALESLAPLMRRLDPVVMAGADALPPADLARELMLIGGPVSNAISSRLHGYRYAGRKISVRPYKHTGLRWCFYYPYQRDDDPKSIRYIFGKLQPTMPKGIIDLNASRLLAPPRFSRFDEATGLIRSDYLLLTVVPNSLCRYSTGSTIIDVADLQGQGQQVFADILRFSDRRKELANALRGKRYFQALYEVPVSHDDQKRTTTPSEAKLIDVHVLT
jgi:hypothetical protein